MKNKLLNNSTQLPKFLNSLLPPQNEIEVVLVNTAGEVLLAAFEDGFPDIVSEDNEAVTKTLQSKL